MEALLSSLDVLRKVDAGRAFGVDFKGEVLQLTGAFEVLAFEQQWSRVGDWRGNGRRMGVAVAGGFRNAGASLPAMAPFPVAALRTGQADLPHPALQWDHAFRTRNTLATAGSR